MDRVRFGRALGLGTRQAVKNLMEMADAATSPNPSAPAARPSTSTRPTPHAQAPVRSTSAARPARGSRESFLSKLKRLGGALWLELVGVFFGIFALFAARGVWALRSALHAGGSSADRQRLVLVFVIAVAFSYFCVSSFIRAHRRERGVRSR